jgi:hypothetical protein
MGNLDGSQINILLLMGEGNPSHGEPNDSDDYQDDSDNGGSFHVVSFLNPNFVGDGLGHQPFDHRCEGLRREIAKAVNKPRAISILGPKRPQKRKLPNAEVGSH